MNKTCYECGKEAQLLSCDRCLGNFCENCRINHNLFRLHCLHCYQILFGGIDWVSNLMEKFNAKN